MPVARARLPTILNTSACAMCVSDRTLLEVSEPHPCTDHTMLAAGGWRLAVQRAGRAARWLRQLRTDDAADVHRNSAARALTDRLQAANVWVVEWVGLHGRFD